MLSPPRFASSSRIPPPPACRTNSTTPSATTSPRYPGVTGWGARILLAGLFHPAGSRSIPAGSSGSGSFRREAGKLFTQVSPPLVVIGQEHVPQDGPCLLLCNHYYRPGFDAWWISLAISYAMPMEVRWVMTAELTYPGSRLAPVMRPLSRFFLRQVEKVYGFFAMPAMPSDPTDPAGVLDDPRQVRWRSATVRRVVEYARSPGPSAVLALAPEGRDIAVDTLGWPPPGGGRFIQQLARLGLSLFPVGVYEQDAALTVRFGLPFTLVGAAGLSSAEIDRQVSLQVMGEIGRLLPERFCTRLPEEEYERLYHRAGSKG